MPTINNKKINTYITSSVKKILLFIKTETAKNKRNNLSIILKKGFDVK